MHSQHLIKTAPSKPCPWRNERRLMDLESLIYQNKSLLDQLSHSMESMVALDVVDMPAERFPGCDGLWSEIQALIRRQRQNHTILALLLEHQHALLEESLASHSPCLLPEYRRRVEASKRAFEAFIERCDAYNEDVAHAMATYLDLKNRIASGEEAMTEGTL
jgi:hypothetical protein